jgi:hypothetical protein
VLILLSLDLIIDNDDSKLLLTQEVSELRENLSCTVNVYSKADHSLLGQAILEVWAMIEHSCNILRQVRYV